MKHFKLSADSEARIGGSCRRKSIKKVYEEEITYYKNFDGELDDIYKWILEKSVFWRRNKLTRNYIHQLSRQYLKQKHGHNLIAFSIKEETSEYVIVSVKLYKRNIKEI